MTDLPCLAFFKQRQKESIETKAIHHLKDYKITMNLPEKDSG